MTPQPAALLIFTAWIDSVRLPIWFTYAQDNEGAGVHLHLGQVGDRQERAGGKKNSTWCVASTATRAAGCAGH